MRRHHADSVAHFVISYFVHGFVVNHEWKNGGLMLTCAIFNVPFWRTVSQQCGGNATKCSSC